MPLECAKVSILEGEEAFDAFSDTRFRDRYSSLLEKTPWATANQNADFLLTWYSAYRESVSPVLVVQWGQGGLPDAVLTLAVQKAGGTLCVAGMPQIDYVAWICEPAIADSFATDSFAALSRRFPGASLRLRYLAPGLPTSWLSRGRDWNGGAIVRSVKRPVLRLDNVAHLKNALRKKSNKSRYNRLRRLGHVEVKSIVGRDELQRWIEQIASFCDIRQGAVNDSVPFAEDPQKLPFHLALAEIDGLVVTTMMLVNGELAAAIVCFCWGTTAAVGLFAISPYLARHSPGKLLVYETALLLAEKGYRELDLTPGGDWKDRFSTGSEEALQVDARFGRGRFVLDRAHHSVCRVAALVAKRAGLKPAAVREVAKQLRYVSLRRVLQKLRAKWTWVAHTQESRIYSIHSREIGDVPADEHVRIDRIEDLVHFRAREPWQSVSEFLGESIKKIGEGYQLFSVVRNCTLAHYGWLIPNQSSSFFPEIGTSYEYPSGTAVLFDFYTDSESRGQGLYQRCLRQMMAAAARREDVTHVFISVRAENLPSKHVIEKVGFKYRASLFRRVRFGRARIWRQEAGQARSPSPS